MTMLVDTDGGRVITIALFGTEEDLRASQAALEDTSPPAAMGKRVSAEVFEVAAEVRR
jgi:hypothetical protein